MQKGDENKNNSNLSDKIDTVWLFACIALGFGVYFIIPFPLSMLASSGIILLMMITMIAHIMKKFNDDSPNSHNKNYGDRMKGIFNTLSLSLYDDPRVIFEHTQVKFYCMCCGKEHKKRKCPSCGSMAVRAG